MRKFNMTYHAQIERIDRLAACIENIGVGEVVLEVERYGAVEQLTDTGLLLVINPTTNALITGYMVTIKQMYAMFMDSGYTKIPDRIYKTVRTNSKKYAFLYKM
jgi:hypothetical protein